MKDSLYFYGPDCGQADYGFYPAFLLNGPDYPLDSVLGRTNQGKPEVKFGVIPEIVMSYLGEAVYYARGLAYFLRRNAHPHQGALKFKVLGTVHRADALD